MAGEGRLGEETNGNLSWGRSRFFKDRSTIGYRYPRGSMDSGSEPLLQTLKCWCLHFTKELPKKKFHVTFRFLQLWRLRCFRFKFQVDSKYHTYLRTIHYVTLVLLPPHKFARPPSIDNRKLEWPQVALGVRSSFTKSIMHFIVIRDRKIHIV
jgi:hypothetical protein